MAPDTVGHKLEEHFASKPLTHYAKGEMIVTPGERSDKAFLVAHGRVKVHELSYRGDEVVVTVIKSPAFFPLNWAVNKIPNHFYYKAETDCDIYTMDSVEVLKFIRDNPDVMFTQLKQVYKALDGILGRMVHRMSGTAKSRLLYELIMECRRFGVNQADGTCRLEATERDLAARAGLTRETVSREMSKLKKQNWVTVNGKGIFIHDIKLLERALGGEL
jgi:CRP/FNR family transcriptional regulator